MSDQSDAVDEREERERYLAALYRLVKGDVGTEVNKDQVVDEQTHRPFGDTAAYCRYWDEHGCVKYNPIDVSQLLVRITVQGIDHVEELKARRNSSSEAAAPTATQTVAAPLPQSGSSPKLASAPNSANSPASPSAEAPHVSATEEDESSAQRAISNYAFSPQATAVIGLARTLDEFKSERHRFLFSSSSLLFGLLELGNRGESKSMSILFLWSRVDRDRYAAVLNDFVDTTNENWRRRYTLAGIPPKSPVPGAVTANARALLARAHEIAKQTSKAATVHCRHLVAALFTGKADKSPTLSGRLTQLGLDRSALCRELLAEIQSHAIDDDSSAWSMILGAVPQPTAPTLPAPPPDSTSSPQRPAVAPLSDSVQLSSISDRAVDEDSLGFKPYVEAMARFIVSEQTEPPLTISIEGRWGSGKSSFMQQLEARIKELTRTSAPGMIERMRRVWREVAPQGDGPVRQWAWRLARYYHATGDRRVLTVRFNAWRHDKSEALWADFATDFLRQLRRQRNFLITWAGAFSLFLRRASWRRAGVDALRKLLLVAGGCLLLLGAAYWVHAGRFDGVVKKTTELVTSVREQDKGKEKDEDKGKEKGKGEERQKGVEGKETGIDREEQHQDHGGKESKSGATSESAKAWMAVVAEYLRGGGAVHNGGLLTSFGLLLTLLLQVWKGGLVPKIDWENYFESPDYRAKREFLARFHEDFEKVVAAFAGAHRICVFVDDLDRCEVPKAAELMQALNLMLSENEHIVFVLGMDREKVAAGIAAKNKELLPFLTYGPADDADARGLEFGYDFIEKFIQIPFLMPTPRMKDFRKFLKGIAGKARLALTDEQAGKIALEDEKEVEEDDTETNIGTPASESGAPVTASMGGAPEQVGESGGGEDKSGSQGVAPQVKEGADESNRAASDLGALMRRLESSISVDSSRVRRIIVRAAPALDFNPRRIKQFINIFRMRAYLADATNLLHDVPGPGRVTLEQLGKLVAIGLRWPLLMSELARSRKLLGWLQRRAERPEEFVDDDAFKKWSKRAALMTLLADGAGDPRSSLGSVDVQVLLSVYPSSEKPPPAAVPAAQ